MQGPSRQSNLTPREHIQELQTLMAAFLKNSDKESSDKVGMKIFELSTKPAFSPISGQLGKLRSVISLDPSRKFEQVTATQNVFKRFNQFLYTTNIPVYRPDARNYSDAVEVVKRCQVGSYLLTSGMGQKYCDEKGKIIEPAFILLRKGRAGVEAVLIYWDETSETGFKASVYHKAPERYKSILDILLDKRIFDKLLYPITKEMFQELETKIYQEKKAD